MKRNLIIYFLMFLFFSVIIISCATSTGSRYSKNDTFEKTDSSDVKIDEKKNENLVEDFDITPYKSKIDVPGREKTNIVEGNNIWYDYGSQKKNTQQKVLVGTEEGFRVLVTTTDNLEDANQIKSDLYSSVDNNEIYIDFVPPFYKVKVGDFNNQKLADNLRFKLNQLGYKDAKVIKENINIFK